MAKRFNIRNTDICQTVDELVSSDMWPFETVSADDFIEASKQLLYLAHHVDDRKIANQKTSPEAYMDRAVGATISMLKCIQKMEMESSAKEMESMLNRYNTGVYNMSFLTAHEFVEYAIDEMYYHNNFICEKLSNDLEQKGVAVRYIDMENERTYVLDEENSFVQRVADSHYEAMKEAYEEIDNLIKYGLPSDNIFVRIKDHIMGNVDIKNNNQTIVDKILNSEADLEIVNLYILPELDLKIKKYKTQAEIEAKNTKNKEDLQRGEMQQSNPTYFRDMYNAYVKARESIENALLIMQKKEKALESNYTISIDKDSRNSTYVLTAQWSCGSKTTDKKSKQINDKIKKSSTVVKEKDRKEKSIKIKIGQSSNRLYEETKRKTACKFGYSNKQELRSEKRALANILSIQTMRREAMIRRQTKVAGQKEFDAKVSFDAAKMEDKVVYSKKQEFGDDKERTIVKASIGVGSASASAKVRNSIPTVSASVSLGNASANVLDVVGASASLGSVGYSSDMNIKGKVQNAVFDRVVSQEQKQAKEAIEEIAKSSMKKIYTISKSGPKAGVNLRISSVTIAESTYDGTVETKNRIPEITDTIQKAVEDITNSEEFNSSESQLDDVNAIDMDVFDHIMSQSQCGSVPTIDSKLNEEISDFDLSR